MELFVDSDVVVSSLISKTGAAYLLLHADSVTPIISSLSQKEIEIVIERLHLERKDFEKLLKARLKKINISSTHKQIQSTFGKYVLDPYDAHIVMGAVQTKVRFLITYNLRHFKIDKMKQDHEIIVVTPGQFLQYVRSLR